MNDAGRKLSSDLNEEFMLAVQENRVADMKMLAEQGAEINMASDHSALTPLHWTIIKGNSEAAHTLIEMGVDVNGGKCSATPLKLLCSTKGSDPGVALGLVKSGADLNRADTIGSETPLHAAACNGRADLVQALIDAGADQTITDKHGRTAEEAMQQKPHVSLSATHAAQREFDAYRARQQAHALDSATCSVGEATPDVLSRDPHSMLAGMNHDQAPVASKARRL